MKILSATFDRGDESFHLANLKIDSVTVQMSSSEAAAILKYFGSISSPASQDNSLFAGASKAGSSIYDALSGIVNGFYENGVDDLIKEVRG